MEQAQRIVTIFEENNWVYGVEKLKQALDQEGEKISCQKIRHVMRKNRLYPVFMRRYRDKSWERDNVQRNNILEVVLDVLHQTLNGLQISPIFGWRPKDGPTPP